MRKKSLEESIIYQGPNEKAEEVINVLKEIIPDRVLLQEKRKLVAHRTDPDLQNRLHNKMKWWVYLYVAPGGVTDLIKIIPYRGCEISCIDLPKDARNVSADFEAKTIYFAYKRYRFQFYKEIMPEICYPKYTEKIRNK